MIDAGIGGGCAVAAQDLYTQPQLRFIGAYVHNRRRSDAAIRSRGYVGEARFAIQVVAAKGLVTSSDPPNWSALAELPWIYPTESACCRRTAERLFASKRFKPKRIVSADRQEIIRTLVASGLGVGLLHADSASDAVRRGEVELLFEAEQEIGVRFAYLAGRAADPLLVAASSIMRGESPR